MNPEKAYYDLYAQKLGESYVDNIENNKNELKRFKSVLDLIDSESKTLLDVGCGSGIFLNFLRDKNPNIKAYGLERSVPLATIARKKLQLSNILEGSADELPFESNTIDIITAMEVIEHLPSGVYQKSLQEIERVAKKKIILTVPYKETRKFVQCPACQCKFSPAYHLRTFNDQVLHSLFTTFKLTEINPIKVELPIGFKLKIKIENFLNLHSFEEQNICPSCSFSYSNESSEKKYEKNKNSNKRFNTDIFPKVQRPVWVAAIYSPI